MFQRFFDAGLAQASFFLACPVAHEAVIIDPRRDVDVYVETARAHGYRIVYSIETHIHADFACGSRELLSVGARPLAGPGANLRYTHHEVQDGERVRVGDLSIQFMHTPGHTPEHISILTSQPDQPTRVFTGDTLFAGAVGRPDLLGEEMTRQLAGQLHDSLFKKLLTLDDRIEVHPGHGAGSLCGAGITNAEFTTIGQERRFNRMLQYADRNEFVAAVLADLPETPAYFARMKKLNQDGPPLLGLVNGYRGPAAISASAAAAGIKNGAIMIDLRGTQSFAERHPLGALNLPHGSKVGYWAGFVLPADARLVLLAADERQAQDAARQLIRVGVSRIDGYLAGGMHAWDAAALPTAAIGITTAQALHGAVDHGVSPLIVDVRTTREWNSGHIDSAMHIPLGELSARASEIPRTRPVATICEGGYRSALAASLLARAGLDDVATVTGGMAAWRQLAAETTL